MNKNLISLDNYTRSKLESYRIKELMLTGIACPECGEELQYSDHGTMLSSPPKKRVNCTECDYKGIIIV
jgi:transcription initiation factor IIE alpha subunit